MSAQRDKPPGPPTGPGQKHDLTQGSVVGHVLRMTPPMAIGFLSMMAFNLADTWFVSRLGTRPLERRCPQPYRAPQSLFNVRCMPRSSSRRSFQMASVLSKSGQGTITLPVLHIPMSIASSAPSV